MHQKVGAALSLLELLGLLLDLELLEKKMSDLADLLSIETAEAVQALGAMMTAAPSRQRAMAEKFIMERRGGCVANIT